MFDNVAHELLQNPEQGEFDLVADAVIEPGMFKMILKRCVFKIHFKHIFDGRNQAKLFEFNRHHLVRNCADFRAGIVEHGMKPF